MAERSEQGSCNAALMNKLPSSHDQLISNPLRCSRESISLA
jgi:hypothetical protein